MILHLKYTLTEHFYFKVEAELHIEGSGTFDISELDLAYNSYSHNYIFKNSEEMLDFIYDEYDIDPDHVKFDESEINKLYEKYKEEATDFFS